MTSGGAGEAGEWGAGDGGRVVSPLAEADEQAIEGALRPRRLSEFVGQARVREQLSLVLEGAMLSTGAKFEELPNLVRLARWLNVPSGPRNATLSGSC